MEPGPYIGRETREAGKDDERTEASIAQVSSFKTDGLHAAFCTAEYVANTIEESDFESELHWGTGASVLGASTTSASGITPKFPGATGHGAFENDVIGVKVVDSLDAFLRFGHGETPPVNIQNADQQSVDLVGNWGNGGEEVGGVLEVGVEGGIAEGC